jgi:peptidoglycan hydrolase CwlO-like protein
MTNIAGQIQDTTSRIDTIEENVVAIGKEIDSLDTRLTAIDNNTNGRMK